MVVAQVRLVPKRQECDSFSPIDGNKIITFLELTLRKRLMLTTLIIIIKSNPSFLKALIILLFTKKF